MLMNDTWGYLQSCCEPCPSPGKTAAGATLSRLIQRRSTLSDRSRSPAAYNTTTPLSVTSLTASVSNSGLKFRLVISTLQSLGHDFSIVSTKPAASHAVAVPRTKGSITSGQTMISRFRNSWLLKKRSSFSQPCT